MQVLKYSEIVFHAHPFFKYNASLNISAHPKYEVKVIQNKKLKNLPFLDN